VLGVIVHNARSPVLKRCISYINAIVNQLYKKCLLKRKHNIETGQQCIVNIESIFPSIDSKAFNDGQNC